MMCWLYKVMLAKNSKISPTPILEFSKYTVHRDYTLTRKSRSVTLKKTEMLMYHVLIRHLVAFWQILY